MIAWIITGILTGTTTTMALAKWRRRRARAWESSIDVRTGESDVIPLRDLLEHAYGDGCLCGPEVIPVNADDGSIRWLYKHHSLDGREQHGSLA